MASLLMLSMHFPSVELLNSHNTDHAWVLLQCMCSVQVWYYLALIPRPFFSITFLSVREARYYHTDEGCRHLHGQEPTLSGSTTNLYSATTPTHYYPSVS